VLSAELYILYSARSVFRSLARIAAPSRRAHASWCGRGACGTRNPVSGTGPSNYPGSHRSSATRYFIDLASVRSPRPMACNLLETNFSDYHVPRAWDARCTIRIDLLDPFKAMSKTVVKFKENRNRSQGRKQVSSVKANDLPSRFVCILRSPHDLATSAMFLCLIDPGICSEQRRD
jgi:hypothetical protein